MDMRARDWIARGTRRAVRHAADVRHEDGTLTRVLVRDLSYTGCRLSPADEFVKGEAVRLSVPGLGDVVAQIRWVREGEAGARFITGDSALDARRARIGV